MLFSGSTEESGEERNEGYSDKSNPAACHELLHSLAFCAGIVVPVTFEKVDCTPDTETGSESDDESLQYIYCAVEEIHIVLQPDFGVSGSYNLADSRNRRE